jgi:hypothetical protein
MSLQPQFKSQRIMLMEIVAANANEIVINFIRKISDLPGWAGMEDIGTKSKNEFGEHLIHTYRCNNE